MSTQIYASVYAVELVTEVLGNAAEKLAQWSNENNCKAVSTIDTTYGLVKAWPSAAWSAVFGVDLDVLFGEVA